MMFHVPTLAEKLIKDIIIQMKFTNYTGISCGILWVFKTDRVLFIILCGILSM